MKKGLVIVLLLSIAFLSGCANLAGILGNQNNAVFGKGVGIRFLPGNPPTNRILEGQEFKVFVELSNSGLTMVSGQLCISDDKYSTYGGIEEPKVCEQFSLAGADENDEGSPSADKFYFPSFDGSGYVYRGIEGDNVDTTITAEVLYNNYRTIINPSIRLCTDSRECSFDESISGAALGRDAVRAPVTVTSVHKTITPAGRSAGVVLEINVENTGGGKIPSLSPNDDREKVGFEISYEGSGIDFDCRPLSGGLILLINGKAMIRCQSRSNVELETGVQENPIEIDLTYDYLTKVDIKEIPLENTD
jgi:hypothetical protein